MPARLPSAPPDGAIIEVVLLRPLVDGDRSWIGPALCRLWGSTVVARKGELVDAAELAGIVAVVDGRPAGLVTYALRDGELEVVTLQAEPEGRGVGRALLDAVRDHARDVGASRMWLITTNDNLRALRFYQQWGMDLVAVILDGVSRSRTVKPEIPRIGQHGIPVRHELELELRLQPDGGAATAAPR